MAATGYCSKHMLVGSDLDEFRRPS